MWRVRSIEVHIFVCVEQHAVFSVFFHPQAATRGRYWVEAGSVEWWVQPDFETSACSMTISVYLSVWLGEDHECKLTVMPPGTGS